MAPNYAIAAEKEDANITFPDLNGRKVKGDSAT